MGTSGDFQKLVVPFGVSFWGSARSPYLEVYGETLIEKPTT